MRWLGFSLLFCAFLFLASNVNALYCLTISQSSDWSEVKMVKGKPGFFTTKVYNSSAEGKYCEPSTYFIELKLVDYPVPFGEVFDGNIQPNGFMLQNGEDRQVLITLTPKVDAGEFIVLIVAKRGIPEPASGVGIVKIVTARMRILVGDEATPGYAAVPFWRIRKDCPGGFVVRQDEDCPRVCESGQKADEQGKCPEDEEKPTALAEEETAPTAFFVLGGLQLSFESFITVLAVIAAVCVIAFSLLHARKLRRQLRHGLR